MITHQSLLELELQHLDSNVRASQEHLSSLLADDFVEFGASGNVWNKADVIHSITREAGDTLYQIENYRVSRLGEHYVLATYQLSAKDHTAPESTPRRSLRSTVWKSVGQQWTMLFHQGTPVLE